MILTYIHSADHQDTDKFCSQVLFGNELITEYINEHFVFWIGDISTIEGYVMANQLRATTHPHLSVIHPNGTIIETFSGSRSYLQLMQEFTVLEQLPLFQEIQENNRQNELSQQQLAVDRMLREEQEEAYQASLRADREREEALRKEREEAEAKKREEEEKIRLEAQKEEEKKQLFEQKLKNLPPEPKEGDVLSLAFRLPNGKRLQRKFSIDNPVQTLYDYVDTHPDTPQTEYSYTLISNFPKKQYPASNTPLKDSGVPNHTVLDIIYD